MAYVCSSAVYGALLIMMMVPAISSDTTSSVSELEFDPTEFEAKFGLRTGGYGLASMLTQEKPPRDLVYFAKWATGENAKRAAAALPRSDFTFSTQGVPTASSVVQTTSGNFTGVSSSTGGVDWLGIPFAQPPVGNLRFVSPQPITNPSPTVQSASSQPNSCPQYGATTGTEDCLYLNIFAPFRQPNDPALLPVMVYIYGGSFTSGSINSYLFQGENLAQTGNVIVVSINYRVGIFGFLVYSPTVNGALPNTTNVGFQDQQLGLQWVQQNIAKFGGDPTKVTIFGESAGAISVCLHIFSPQSSGLFQRAIMESSSCTYGIAGNATGLALNLFGYARQYSSQSPQISNLCSQATTAALFACLQNPNVTTANLLQLEAALSLTYQPFFPVVDNNIIPGDPLALLLAGHYNRNINFISGINTNEGTDFVNTAITNPTGFYGLIAYATGYTSSANLTQIYNMYNPANLPYNLSSQPFLAAQADLLTDFLFVCPSRRLVNLAAVWQVADSRPANYYYHFNHLLSWVNCTANANWCQEQAAGVFHTSELYFVFDHPQQVNASLYGGTPTFTCAESSLSSQMMQFWTSFASTGLPQAVDNGAAVNLVWPSFQLSNVSNIVFDTPLSVEAYTFRATQCNFWDSLTLGYPFTINTGSTSHLAVLPHTQHQQQELDSALSHLDLEHLPTAGFAHYWNPTNEPPPSDRPSSPFYIPFTPPKSDELQLPKLQRLPLPSNSRPKPQVSTQSIPTTASSVVQTTSGSFTGITSSTTGINWLGIPFAQKPLGHLRFMPPQPITNPSSTVVSASSQPNACIQYGTTTYTSNEDCLYLNIFAPFRQPNDPTLLPVMVYIYGGSFTSGSISNYQFQGENLAQTGNVIVVTINYRVGIFGFLVYAPTPSAAFATNVGFQDQQAGLRWVQQNIANFGGDPNRVTIFGESAGAISVCLHIFSPQSKGLFQRAIMESSSCTYGIAGNATGNALSFFGYQRQYALQSSQFFNVYCNLTTIPGTFACLQQSLPAAVLQQFESAFPSLANPFFPVIDGVIIPDDPLTLLIQGKYNRNITFISGVNTNEGSAFVSPSINTTTDLYGLINYATGYTNPTILGTIGYNYLSPYMNSSLTSVQQVYAAQADLFTDFVFVCPTRRLLNLSAVWQVADSRPPNYFYHFNHPLSWVNCTANAASCGEASLGVYHTEELFFVFDHAELESFPAAFSCPEISLSSQMMQFWSSFAYTGLPQAYASNAAVNLVWPGYNLSNAQNIVFDTPLSLESNTFRQSLCAYWDSITIGYPFAINTTASPTSPTNPTTNTTTSSTASFATGTPNALIIGALLLISAFARFF